LKPKTPMLKPSDLKVTGKYRTLDEHEKLVLASLNRIPNKLITNACKDILNAHDGTKINVTGLNASVLNEIKNFFAEVSGPKLLLNDKLIPGISPNSKVFFSDLDNERLFDFKIVINGKEHLVSNKRGGSAGTNTLKPGDVISLIDKDKELTRKWKNTKYYRIFKILDENSVVVGPLKALSEEYPTKHPISKRDYDKIIKQLDSYEAVIPPKDIPRGLMDMIKRNPDAFGHYKKRGVAAATMLNFLFERSLVEESVKDSKYNDLFVDVTSGNVLFLKFDINNKGEVHFHLADPKKASKKAILRSKQGVERRSSSSGRLKLDKLGFQP